MRRFLLFFVVLLGGCIFSPGQSPDQDTGGSNNPSSDMADDGSSPPNDGGGTGDDGGGQTDVAATDSSSKDSSPPVDMTQTDASTGCPSDCGACRVCDPADGVCMAADDPTGCDLDVLDCQTAICVNGECGVEIKTGYCVIENECVQAGAPNPDDPCLFCAPDNGTDFWTPAPTGTECTEYQAQCLSSVCDGAGHCVLVTSDQLNGTSCNGGICPQGASRGCNAGLCVCPIQGSVDCFDGSDAYSVGDHRPDDPCEWCGPDGWEDRPDGALCDTEDGAGSCMSGTCELF